MAGATFGRRGIAPQTAVPWERIETRDVSESFVRTFRTAESAQATQSSSFLSDMPFVTIGIVGLLYLVFMLERHFAFDIGKKSTISYESLIAFGAISYDLVVRSGEWWRILLAPLLHKDAFHLFGNCFALLFVGARLEPMIGRGWFAGIFLVSALGGVAGSLFANPPEMTSVGASGAIMGLIGALFAMSFHNAADGDTQKAMRRTALRFGVPALLPLAIGATGHVDHHAHLGGLLAGVAIGLGLTTFWSGTSLRPAFAGAAGAVSLLALVGSMLSFAFASTHFAAEAADAAQLIPTLALPATDKEGLAHSAELVARYPKDPRSHLLQAATDMKDKNLIAAEHQLRKVMDMVPDSPGAIYRPAREVAQTNLALVLVAEKRRDEARELSRPICQSQDQLALRTALAKANLCD